ncbi:MAG: transposase [Ktedonobacterales bacterium]|nr:transposase [Ktedonobacterales bacterium]
MKESDGILLTKSEAHPATTPRAFPPEFTQEAVRLLETSGKSCITLAKELGISDSVRYRWRTELRASGDDAFPGKGHQSDLEEEVRRLRRENDLGFDPLL